MGGGAAIWLQSKSHSTLGVAPRDGEKTLVAQWIREARRGWWEARETVARGLVTKIVDRRQRAVIGRRVCWSRAPRAFWRRGALSLRRTTVVLSLETRGLPRRPQ